MINIKQDSNNKMNKEDSDSDINDDDDRCSDWESDDDNNPVKSLFSNIMLSNVTELIQYDEKHFNFNIKEIAINIDNKLKDETLIMLVNYIRRTVSLLPLSDNNSLIDEGFINNIKTSILTKAFLDDERNMMPVLQEDALLFSLKSAITTNNDVDDDDDDYVSRFNGSTELNTNMKSDPRFEEMLNRYNEISKSMDAPNDEYYFDSYSHFSIHETMLRDDARTIAYANALQENADYFKGKVVLDIGCGTGILCLFAAKAGAKKVVGIDLSSIIDKSRKIVEKNGYSDVITLVKGRLENTVLPLEAGEVDVIVSEWMGYALYYENMLSSVIFARNKYLATDGIMLPTSACLFIEAMTAKEQADRVSWWTNVYGFDMMEIADLLTGEAQVQYADKENIISDRFLFHNLDTKLASDKDLDFESNFEITIDQDTILNAFVISFDVLFDSSYFSKNITLTTSAQTKDTHWKQTVLWLQPEYCEQVAKNTIIKGTIKYIRTKENIRDYAIQVNWTILEKSFNQKFNLVS